MPYDCISLNTHDTQSTSVSNFAINYTALRLFDCVEPLPRRHTEVHRLGTQGELSPCRACQQILRQSGINPACEVIRSTNLKVVELAWDLFGCLEK